MEELLQFDASELYATETPSFQSDPILANTDKLSDNDIDDLMLDFEGKEEAREETPLTQQEQPPSPPHVSIPIPIPIIHDPSSLKWGIMLTQLQDMGFSNRELNLSLLEQFGGDILAVVHELLNL